MGDAKPSTGHRNGLIESFAASEPLVIRARQGFARLNEMLNMIDVVDVERAKIQDVFYWSRSQSPKSSFNGLFFTS